MTEQERIAFIIERYEGCQNVRFARRIGTSKSSVTKLLDGSFRIGTFAERIIRAYPEIDARWLLTGEGNPIAGDLPKEEILQRLDRIEKKLDRRLR